MGSTKDELIERIIHNAFDALSDWQPPRVISSVIDGFPDVFAKFQDDLTTLRRDFAFALNTYTFEELKRGFPNSHTPAFNPLFDQEGRHWSLAKRLAKLKATKPQDFVGGWSVSGKEIDTSHWRGFQTYTLAEATLLSVGRDPRLTNFAALFRGYGRSEEADEMLYFLEDRFEEFANGLGLDPEDEASTIDVDTLFEWITMNRVRIDPRFRRMLNERKKQADRRAHNSGPIEPRHIDKPLHGSTWRVHARIVTAMAASKYDLRKENNIGRAAKAIQHDADLIGLGFDVATIRKLLRAGFEEYRSQNAAK